jgi:hypothetical protein
MAVGKDHRSGRLYFSEKYRNESEYALSDNLEERILVEACKSLKMKGVELHDATSVLVGSSHGSLIPKNLLKLDLNIEVKAELINAKKFFDEKHKYLMCKDN